MIKEPLSKNITNDWILKGLTEGQTEIFSTDLPEVRMVDMSNDVEEKTMYFPDQYVKIWRELVSVLDQLQRLPDTGIDRETDPDLGSGRNFLN